MKTRNVVRWSMSITIPSDTSVGCELINDLLEAMVEREWPSAELFHVQLAYQEAIVNAIVHGNRRAADKTVEIEMSCDHGQVRIQITDQGPGFDPQNVPDPRQEEWLEAPGGRGLLLMSEILSELMYNDLGNQVTLIKNKGGEAPLPAE